MSPAPRLRGASATVTGADREPSALLLALWRGAACRIRAPFYRSDAEHVACVLGAARYSGTEGQQARGPRWPGGRCREEPPGGAARRRRRQGAVTLRNEECKRLGPAWQMCERNREHIDQLNMQIPRRGKTEMNTLTETSNCTLTTPRSARPSSLVLNKCYFTKVSI